MGYLVHPVLIILTAFVAGAYGFIYVHAYQVGREDEAPPLMEPAGILAFFVLLQGLIYLLGVR